MPRAIMDLRNMNRLAYIYISMIVVTLFGCNGRKITSQLEAVSKIADANPDSALIVLMNTANKRMIGARPTECIMNSYG